MRGVETEWKEAWWRHGGWETSFAGPGGNCANPEAWRSFLRASWRLCTPSLTTQVQEKDSYSPDYVSYQYELTEQVGSPLLKWDQQQKQKHYAFYANHPEKKTGGKNAKNTSKRQTPEMQTFDREIPEKKLPKEKLLKEKLL